MEYIAGTSVKGICKALAALLPPAEAIAYVLSRPSPCLRLPAPLENLVYCDFKPDNFMLEGDPPDVKLIDMGGVRMIDDPGGDIYGTRGYRAPEASEGGRPSPISDLFTVGRSLAVLG